MRRSSKAAISWPCGPMRENGDISQPMLAVWAELNVVLADEFRDGNVPAMMDPLAVARKAFAALPETVKTYYYRGDSACHESSLMNWLRNGERPMGRTDSLGSPSAPARRMATSPTA